MHADCIYQQDEGIKSRSLYIKRAFYDDTWLFLYRYACFTSWIMHVCIMHEHVKWSNWWIATL